MRAGERASYNGYQVCLFPMDMINITQTSSPSSLSHCCGHPCDYIGTTPIYPIYAPCDCHLIYSDGSAQGNNRIYASNSAVWTPSGLSQVTFMFTHDDNPPLQQSFTQGSLIAHTGSTPSQLVTGDHCHMDQSLRYNAQLVSYGVYCAFGNLCYALQDSAYPYDVFYLSGSERVYDTKGYTFQIWRGSPITYGNFKWWMSRYILNKRKGKI